MSVIESVVPERERHTLVFDDIDVEVVIDTQGNVDVNFRRDGEKLTSFSHDVWVELGVFVARAAEMTADRVA